MIIRPLPAALIVTLLVLPLLRTLGGEVVLHDGEDLDGIQMSWSFLNPKGQVEINNDPRFISKGRGSILAHSEVPVDADHTSYVGFRVAVGPLTLDDRTLAFDAWSTEPDATKAFHVRGLNAKGKIVAGWGSWSHPLDPEKQSFLLVSGESGPKLKWEASHLEAPDDEIVFLEFIAGSVAKGKPYNMYVDHIRLLPTNAATE